MSGLMNSRVLTLALLVGCAAAANHAIEALSPEARLGGTNAETRAVAAAPGEAPHSPRAVEPLPDLEALGETVERPLFEEGRRPVVEEPEVAEAEPPAEINVFLSGIVITDGGKFAHLRANNDPKVRILSEGDAVESWKIETILPDRVVLRAGDQRQELILKDQKPRAPTTRNREVRRRGAPPRRAQRPPRRRKTE